MQSDSTQTHSPRPKCPDCSMCQGCSETRCRACRGGHGHCARKKLSIEEQIALFNSLNSEAVSAE